MSLIFNKIVNENIFTQDFNPLVRNNEIVFSASEKIAVIYGPNGTGKTSLIKTMGDEKGTKIQFSLDGVEYQEGSEIFHIINDQNYRNIIVGETRDFFLGDDIRREFELQDQVTADRTLFIAAVINLLKSRFGITASNSPLINLVTKDELSDFIKDCANSKSKGDKYSTDAIVTLFTSLKYNTIPDYDTEKLLFLQSDLADKKSIIKKIESMIGSKIAPNNHVHEIEENTEAIGILNRFHKDKCIVCDNENIDWEKLLTTKKAQRQATMDALEDNIRELIEMATPLGLVSDPFGIKECLLYAVANGDVEAVENLCKELSLYESLYESLIENELIRIMSESDLNAHYTEYKRVIEGEQEIADEDYLYIQEIINNSMSKSLTVERDNNKRLRIYLSNQEFLGKTRDELPLSTGEQNFLSLSFEFLRAKNSKSPIVVIDDPISSFDSIYKNKVVYAIVKMLNHKKRIVLTHNTDLIRLLDGQHKHCFNLYLLNNTEGELNGFIPLNNTEEEMLVSLEKLLTAFRNNVPKSVVNPGLFLISMIPFMRGYANIVNNKRLYDSLTQVMHGYKTKPVDIAKAYSELFGSHDETLPANYEVSVPDILNKTVDGVNILDNEKFPLLDRTLRHSFMYLFLRLLVEKKLVEKYNIDTTRFKQLGQIISAAYPNENDIEQIRNRIRLTSKKTLINEFNHFEGNLSIFQPAIDITDQELGKERTDIVTFINTI